MESSAVSVTNGVLLPNYPLASGFLLRAIEHSGSVLPTSTDDAGEYYAMALAKVVQAEEVPANSIMVIPLTPPRAGESLDFTYVAASDCMYVQLHEQPQFRRTYGHCVAYSADVTDKPVAIGEVFKFSTIASFIVAQRQLSAAVISAGGLEMDVIGDLPTEKRQCVRPLVEMGELADETGTKPKGTSVYLLDLNGNKLFTRNKSDIPQREKDLSFLLRAMDKSKMDYSTTTDLVLQTEVYRCMLCEQGDTQADDRHNAFMSCGLISRVQRLLVFSKSEKLKPLLTGSVLVEGSAEATLTLEDFVTGEKIASRTTVCASNNSGLISALKNLQTVMQIVFSDDYESCLDEFIEKLEGAIRPMELVASDFLKYSVELTLRKVFRTIRSVKSISLSGLDLQGPGNCALFISNSFAKLADDLSDHQLMSKLEAFYRLKLSRKNDGNHVVKAEAPAPKLDRQTVKFAEVKSEDKVSGASKVCSGHFGKQLGAVRKDGRAYACGFGKDCTFVHTIIDGRSKEKLSEIASSMPSPMKQDMLRAIQARK